MSLVHLTFWLIDGALIIVEIVLTFADSGRFSKPADFALKDVLELVF